ncbi:hypothetical protein G6F27_013835 [Rhizopus arrhizus]|nr:hypothetical protein G6F27_013835 [Rhizopus arrhizus]
MLKLCEDHSLSLGYRWNPLKCAVLNHPTSSSSSSGSTQLKLYGTPLPLVDKFVYLGMPFIKTGLSAASVLPLRSPGVLQLMGILNKIGVNRQGFSLLLCARIYATFVRPKFEYGLAISKFSAAQVKEIERLQDRCLRMMMCLQLVSAFVRALFLVPACCRCCRQLFQCLVSKSISTRIRSGKGKR